MRSRPIGATVRGMQSASRRLTLLIDEEAGPLHGRVAEADGASHEFEGWLALLTVLGTLLDAPASGTEHTPPSTSSH